MGMTITHLAKLIEAASKFLSRCSRLGFLDSGVVSWIDIAGLFGKYEMDQRPVVVAATGHDGRMDGARRKVYRQVEDETRLLSPGQVGMHRREIRRGRCLRLDRHPDPGRAVAQDELRNRYIGEGGDDLQARAQQPPCGFEPGLAAGKEKSREALLDQRRHAHGERLLLLWHACRLGGGSGLVHLVIDLDRRFDIVIYPDAVVRQDRGAVTEGPDDTHLVRDDDEAGIQRALLPQEIVALLAELRIADGGDFV